ncbi:MAG TPA: hypothetical protein VK357_08385 [Rubrobacteraceae bacterium]|nr:hypothetical protein [Rubrobacteraceae bacterium]
MAFETRQFGDTVLRSKATSGATYSHEAFCLAFPAPPTRAVARSILALL